MAEKRYAVVIGKYLTKSDAENLNEKASRSGYFKEIRIYNLAE